MCSYYACLFVGIVLFFVVLFFILFFGIPMGLTSSPCLWRTLARGCTYFVCRWGVLNREIVSFRPCVPTRGLVAQWNWISNCAGRPFPFSLLARVSRGAFPLWARVVLGSFPFSLLVPGAFPFPFPHPPNLLSNFSWAYRVYIYVYILVRTRAFHARRMLVSVLSATCIRDPAQLSVSE